MHIANEYRGVWIPVKCPNKCFERLVDKALDNNIIDGVEPRIRTYNSHLGYTAFEIFCYSKRLKRHSTRANGHYISERWTHCPLCGAKLI